MPKTSSVHEITIDKLVHGGQGLGVLPDGKKAFVWGTLPGEKVSFKVTKKRKDFVEGVVEQIHKASSHRTPPKDEHYLSTSPWQIISEAVEDTYKAEILTETFNRAGIKFGSAIISEATTQFYHYRNKMEYSFYGDDNGLHLALYNRGTHRKQIVDGSSIAMPVIDEMAGKILAILKRGNIRASDLKTLILRCSQNGEVVAALFVKDENFPKLEDLKGICKGIVVVYSNPKSPASVRTKDLYQHGDVTLMDLINGTAVTYDVFSFFQVNVPVFDKTVKQIEKILEGSPAVDMYSGVGSIGLALKSVDTLVESDEVNYTWAVHNVGEKNVRVVHAPSEKALDYINAKKALIIDPPRVGLHKDLIDVINQVKPPKVVYLSCNPSTQARDIALLQKTYVLKEVYSYNFFPHTPHIESLACLVRR